MNHIIEQTRKELLSFCTGEPIIATLCNRSENLEEYHLLIYVRSISDFVPTYVQSIQLHFLLTANYPYEPPKVKHKTNLFHPNFSASSGEWADNAVRQYETIEDYLLRLIRVLQFKEINADKVANRNAMAWYNKRLDSGLFPTDRINYNAKPRITIKNINNVLDISRRFEVDL